MAYLFIRAALLQSLVWFRSLDLHQIEQSLLRVRVGVVA